MAIKKNVSLMAGALFLLVNSGSAPMPFFIHRKIKLDKSVPLCFLGCCPFWGIMVCDVPVHELQVWGASSDPPWGLVPLCGRWWCPGNNSLILQVLCLGFSNKRKELTWPHDHISSQEIERGKAGKGQILALISIIF